jgi:DNA ligase 1
MLAATLKNFNDIALPVVIQPKIDGHRCYKHSGETYTGRNGKDVENNFIRETIRAMTLDDVDGELIVPGVPFHQCSGELRRHDSKPNFIWWLFDKLNPCGFIDRYSEFVQVFMELRAQDPLIRSRVRLVPTIYIHTVDEFVYHEEKFVEQGFEGIILRSPGGLYKQGRSTLKEFSLVKYKRWLDDEAIITGFEEQYENQNEATTNSFGLTERSSDRGNLRGKDTLGALIAEWKGRSIRVGTGEGLTTELRRIIWEHKEKYLGAKFTFKYLPIGTKDLPRQPIFKAFRYE